MRSMRLPLVAIFFMTYFYRAGGGRMAPLPCLDLLLVFLIFCFIALDVSLRRIMFLSKTLT